MDKEKKIAKLIQEEIERLKEERKKQIIEKYGSTEFYNEDGNRFYLSEDGDLIEEYFDGGNMSVAKHDIFGNFFIDGSIVAETDTYETIYNKMLYIVEHEELLKQEEDRKIERELEPEKIFEQENLKKAGAIEHFISSAILDSEDYYEDEYLL